MALARDPEFMAEQMEQWFLLGDLQSLKGDPFPKLNKVLDASAIANAEQDRIRIGTRAGYAPCPSPERFMIHEATTLPRWWEEKIS